MSYSTVFYVLGWLIVSLSITMGLPILASITQGDSASLFAFVTSAALTAFFGGGLIISLRGSARREAGRRESLFLAVIVWIVLPIFAALPFYGSGTVPSVTDSYFEAVSGFTTTGMSIIDRPEELPRAILLWRSMLQWMGGLVAVTMGLTVLAIFGIGGLQLYQGNLPRGEADTIFRRIKFNARAVVGYYSALTLIAILALWSTGHGLFASLSISFAAVSTSGFLIDSTKPMIMGDLFSNVTIAAVLIVSALPAPVLIETFRGRWRNIRDLPEMRDYWFVMVLTMMLFVGYSVFSTGQATGLRIMQDILQAISILTTSGLPLGGTTVVDTHPLPIYLIVMVIGGCALSTAGGIKIMRLVLLMKQGNRELYRLSFPRGVAKFLYGGQRVELDIIWSVWTFFAIFTLCISAVVALLALNGLQYDDALEMGVATLTTTGVPHLATGLMFSDMSHGAKWVATAAMIVGRLEILAFFVVLYRSFWRN